MKPVVQVALDLTSISEAIKIGRAAASEGVQWIEAGTPLIKSEGLKAVRELKQEFPENIIVADMKTMDTGELEVSMAADAGADVVSVLAASPQETIEGAVKAAEEHNVKLLADLIACPERKNLASKLEELGVDYVGVHVGIDQQRTGMSPLDHLKSISDSVEIPIAVAGGLTAETIPETINSGATIIVVGGAITGAEDVSKAAQEIVEATKEG
ncbi:MAG: orotidine 5'-phosphate decarboxylase [Hadesarchaea archaeon]|nr:orotidine 5'-phosphate decarboxylase [Hadesarchaea archaeon]